MNAQQQIDYADTIAGIETIPPDGWFAMAKADAELLSDLIGSPYVMTDAKRREALDAARRLQLFVGWAEAHGQALMTIAGCRP